MPELITSAANPLVKRIRALGDRRTRRTESAYLVEGVQPVWRALDAAADFETLVVAPELVAGSPATRLVEQARTAGVPVAELAAGLFRRIASKDSPAGVMAIIRGSIGLLADLQLPAGAAVVALHEVASPGNLGTIIRTADSAAMAAVVTIGASTDPLSPAAVKASMGSLFAVRLAHAPDLDEFFAWTDAQSMRVTTTSARATTSHWDAEWSGANAILLGSEGDGLDQATIARGQQQVRIPMLGTASSLNLAVAAGILMVESRRAVLAQRP